MEAQNAIYLDEETGGKGRQFKSRFLVPGLVKYDYGVCLLTKENADKFIQGFVGCPVVINHQEVTDDNAKAVSVGNIFSVWFDEKDGYYWCNGIINDKQAIELINKGYSVSCQYTITEYSDNDSNALHNGNPYDKIIENGKPEHLAIVNNPRYEGAKIAVNAIMAQNEDKWITIHPNGEENKGRHLLLKDGESVEDAMHRNGWYNKRQAKKDNKEKKERTFIDNKTGKEQSLKDLVEKGLTPVRYGSSLWDNKPSYGIGDGKIEYQITEEEYKQALEHQKNKKSSDLQKAKEQSKDLTDYVKWQYNVDIEPHITRRVGDKTLVEWDKLSRETQSALKRLDFDDKVNLEQYSASEMSIEVKDKKIFENLEKHRQNISEQKQSNKEEKGERTFIDKKEKRLASEEWENKYRGSKKQRELYNTKTNELAIALLDNNKEKAEYLKGMTLILKERRDENYINRQKEIFENIKKQDKDLYNEPLIQGQIEALKIIEEEQKASNSFEEDFKDTLYTALAEGIANRLGELIASNEDKWITIHPHGEESDDYRRLLIKDGETVEDAMHRQGYYNKRQAKDEKQKKELEEKIKQLLEKARRIGGEKTILGQKYLKQAEELKKGNLEVEEKETTEKDNKKQASLQQSKHFEKFNKISDEEKKAHDEWAAKQKEYNDELEKNKEYKELEKKIVELRKQIMTTDYRDKEKYLSLQAAKNELQKRQNDIRGEVEKRVGLYDAQHKWSDIHSAKEDERKNLIKNSSNDIKQQINKISSRNDKVVKSFDSLKEDPYIVHKNKEYSLKKEYDDLFEKYSKMEWGTDEYKATYQKAKEKQAEYQSAYWQSKKMLADFAPKISKILQVENGLKFETKAENKAMEENAKRLKEVLDGIIPNNVLDNKPINIHQTGKVRAFQSGQSINLHNEERIGTIIHETAHQLEENNPQMLINSLAFAKSRTEGEKQKALKKFNSSYTRDEYCKPDKFFDPYCGKLYTLFGGRDRSFVDGTASEIMSMGLQRIFEDPINFVKEDREYFDFVLSNLRGELWD